MTPHRGRRLMHREGDRALGTTWHVAARGTLDERRKPAAIEQQDDLLAALQSTRDGGIECLAPRNHSWRGGGLRRRDPRRASQIHDLHRRQRVRPASARSPSDNPEWSTATRSPKTPRTRATVCGVRAISGTSRIAPCPDCTTARSTSRYTSVLPELVTPWIKTDFSTGVSAMPLTTARWASVRLGGGGDDRSAKGSRISGTRSMRASPC